MKNADLIRGQVYAWSRYKPRGDDPIGKVTALGPALGPSQRIGQIVRFEEPYVPRWGSDVEAGVERWVPAREILGPWSDFQEKVETKTRLQAKGARLVEEIQESLRALDLDRDGERVHVSAATLLDDVKVTVVFTTADRAQRFSDALSFAVVARDG